MPVVVQAGFGIVELAGEAQVKGGRAGGGGVAEGIAVPAPDHGAGGVGGEARGVKVIGVQSVYAFSAGGRHQLNRIGNNLAVGLIAEGDGTGCAGGKGVAAQQYPLPVIELLVDLDGLAAAGVSHRVRRIAGVAAVGHPAGIHLVAASDGHVDRPDGFVPAQALALLR